MPGIFSVNLKIGILIYSFFIITVFTQLRLTVELLRFYAIANDKSNLYFVIQYNFFDFSISLRFSAEISHHLADLTISF